MGIGYVTESYISDGSDLLSLCWSGAKDRVDGLTEEQLDALVWHLEEIFADSEKVTDTMINDYIWFEEDTWKEAIGYKDEDDEDEESEEEDSDEDEEDESEESNDEDSDDDKEEE